jgi:hypothetical protein
MAATTSSRPRLEADLRRDRPDGHRLLSVSLASRQHGHRQPFTDDRPLTLPSRRLFSDATRTISSDKAPSDSIRTYLWRLDWRQEDVDLTIASGAEFALLHYARCIPDTMDFDHY